MLREEIEKEVRLRSAGDMIKMGRGGESSPTMTRSGYKAFKRKHDVSIGGERYVPCRVPIGQ